MEYTSDSDVSDDTRELVSQGLASARRKRSNVRSNIDSVTQRRLVLNTDTSSVRHPVWTENIDDAASTRELDTLRGVINTSQNHNSTMNICKCTLFYIINDYYIKDGRFRNAPEVKALPLCMMPEK